MLAPLALALVLPFAVPLVPQDAQAADPAQKTVKVVVDFSDGVEWHFTAVPWAEGMTVMDTLEAAPKGPRGLSYKSRGSGETAFVTEIAEVAGEGGTGRKRNWIYKVNGELAQRGAGVVTIKPGDTVKWTYSPAGLKP
jgi:hypothetical protein